MSLPNAATALVFRGYDRPLNRERILITPPGPGELLVRISACTVCGSDIHTLLGRRTTPIPTILGHEIIGEVAALHPDSDYLDVTGEAVRLGDRITWAIAASCGTCFFCIAGLPQKCEHLFKYGHEPLDKSPKLSGGLAEYCHLARGTHVMRLPSDLPDAVACPANCATATVAAALRVAGPCEGQTVLVQGAGMLGITACAMAASMGAVNIVLCDPDEKRVQAGKRFGATHVHRPSETSAPSALRASANEGRGFDLILEMSGAQEAIRDGLELLRIGGRYVWVGSVFPGPSIEVNPESVTRRLLTLAGVHNYTPPDLVSAVRFLADNRSRFPFETLVTRWYSLHEFETALAFAIEAKPPRVGVRL